MAPSFPGHRFIWNRKASSIVYMGMESIESELVRCEKYSDDELWDAIPRLARGEREELAKFLIHLGEVEKRDLHLERAYSGLFKYLLTFGFSEWESRARAVAARAARRYPSILKMIAEGRMHLYAVVLVWPYLTPENHEALLGKACRRTTRELQTLIATLDPKAARRDAVRVISVALPALPLAESEPAQSEAASPAPGPFGDGLLFPEPPPAPAPSTTTRLRFSFDGSEELDDLIKRARDLLQHKHPYGGMEHIFYDALQALLDRIDPDRRIERRLARAKRRDEFRHQSLYSIQ